MEVDQAVDLVRESLTMMLLISAPILAAALVIGLLISLFQAVTQIQEQTLSFVPKIVGMAVVTILLAPWMTRQMMEFASRLFGGG
ncbi:MAG: flagellar biosynthesis protein FliQ [Phycisphaeraceae bacterium]